MLGGDPKTLGQSFVLAPTLSFEQLDARLQSLGWTRSETAGTTAPLLPKEPELAGWDRHSNRPRITYTFNPIVHLRVLEVASVSPVLRSQIADCLPVLDGAALLSRLDSAEPSSRLLGILGLSELRLFEAIAPIEALHGDSDEAVSQAAHTASVALRREAEARLQALAGAQLVATATAELLQELRHGGTTAIAELKPKKEDYGELFHQDIAAEVAGRYAELWKQPPRVNPGMEYSEVDVVVAAAGMLRSHNELSDKFPGGYRAVAGWMKPERLWLCWRYHAPAQRTGVAYDGLAMLGNGRWCWCPKPYGIVGAVLASRAGH